MRYLDLRPKTSPGFADAALAFVRTALELEGTTGPRALELAVQRDWQWHETLIAAGEECGCDPGTCPSR